MTTEVPASEKTPKKAEGRSLIKKLAKIMAQVERVEKRGENSFHHYKYAIEADLVDAIRPLLAAENVVCLPTLMETNRYQHTNAKGNLTFITDVKMKWTFEDGDSGETREVIFPGCGEDSGDKGVYKAMTGSEKYLLLKTFLIATGDDPEKDEAEPKQGAQVRDYKLKQPAVSPAAPAGKVPNSPLGKPGDEMTVSGPISKYWENAEFLNIVVNKIRLWTKDAEVQLRVREVIQQIKDGGGLSVVDAYGKVGRTPTALELIDLSICEDAIEEDEPQEIPF